MTQNSVDYVKFSRHFFARKKCRFDKDQTICNIVFIDDSKLICSLISHIVVIHKASLDKLIDINIEQKVQYNLQYCESRKIIIHPENR